MMRTTIDNTQDVMDSRDIIERIEELEGALTEAQEEAGGVDSEFDARIAGIIKEPTHWHYKDAVELVALKKLAGEAEDSPDWQYGEALIRESHFTAYAQDLANDFGAVHSDAAWPTNHIDWDAAAEALKSDYFEVDFDGVTYLIRA